MAPPALRPHLLALSLAAALPAVAAAPAQAGGGCVSAECYRRVTTPPVYDTVSERVLVEPGARRWVTRYDAYGQLVGCWVTTPPRYAVQTRRVLVRPPETIPETLPPVYATSYRRVLVQPARAAWVPAVAPGVEPGPLGIGSIPDAIGIAGASSADVAVGLGFSRGSIYDGY